MNEESTNWHNCDQFSNKTTSIFPLSIPELLMLHYAETFCTEKNIFQQFWKYKYDIEPAILLQNLYEQNFIEIGGSELALNRKTVQELKAFLKENNLPIAGKKQDLIFRIIENISTETLDTFCNIKSYKITDKGKQFTMQIYNAVYAHRHSEYGLTENDIYNTNEKIQDIAFYNVFTMLKLNTKESNWGLVRNSSYDLSDISIERNDYITSLKFLIIGVYIDLSGVCDEYAIKNGTAVPGENYCCYIFPFSIKRISDMMDRISMSIDDFILNCTDIINGINLPYSYYDKAAAIEIIVNEILSFKNISTVFDINQKL